MVCPEDYLWGFNQGDSCCKYYYRKSDPETDLVFEDGEDECPLAAFANCTSNEKCKTKPGDSALANNYFVPRTQLIIFSLFPANLYCPRSFPFLIESGCCQRFLSEDFAPSSPTCTPSEVTTGIADGCCHPDKLYSRRECVEKERKCLGFDCKALRIT